MGGNTTTARRALGAAVASLAILIAYLRWFRPWHLRWGTTEPERF